MRRRKARAPAVFTRKRTVQWTRRKLLKIPSSLKSLIDLQIPLSEYAVYHPSPGVTEDFLLLDSVGVLEMTEY